MTPTRTLLEALAGWLRDDLQPGLAGRHAFENRIAVNLLGTLQREQQLEPALRQRDAAIAAACGLPAQGLSAALSRALRDGQVAGDPDLLDALRQRAMLRCAIDCPRYPGLAQARERWPRLAGTLDADLATASPDGPATSAKETP